MASVPNVSIIMPAYNAAHCISKAVESALCQTDPDFELVIVDDGSTDSTPEIIRTLAQSDGRIRPIFLPNNQGAACALNVATRAARGKWISLLDADDWYEPTRLERLLVAGEVGKVQMVADNQEFFDRKAERSVRLAFPNRGRSQRIDLTTFLQNTDPTASFDYGMLKPFFLASFIRDHSVLYREHVRHGYDYFVLLDFFVAGGQGLLIDEPLYWYVQPFGTISREWANPLGRRYPFEHVKLMNDAVVEEMRNQLSHDQLQSLISRGEAIQALACLHQLREQLGAAGLRSAISIMTAAPPRFWTLCAERVSGRLLQAGARFAHRRTISRASSPG